MKHPWVNILLLALLTVQALTGFAGLINGAEASGWMLRVHDAGAFAITLLLIWKGRVILDSLRRRRSPAAQRAAFIGLLVLLLAVLGTGLYWVFAGRMLMAGYSLITLHIILAIVMATLLAWHVLSMRFIFSVPRATGRRAFLRLALTSLAGFAVWRSSEQLLALLNLPGARRRFTGSYEVGSFTGEFPLVSWLFDYPAPVAPAGWSLTVAGAVRRPFSIDYRQLEAMATDSATELLDCTGGWYSTQDWQGVSVRRLLDMAEVSPRARSATFEAVSGYSRRFAIQDAGRYLLATRVAGEVLTHGHGFPARVVAPGHRGFDWVKWVTRIEVSETSEYLQPPVPLQ